MTTNGVLLDKNIEFLVENNFNIVISLDGGTESNNSYRKAKNQQPVFKKIFNNILEIQDKYPDFFKEHVNFNSVLHNKNSFSEIYEFFQKKFNKTPLVSELDRDSINPNFTKEFWEMQESVNSSLQNNNKLLNIEKEHYVGAVDDLTRFIFSYSGFVKSGYLDLIYNFKNNPKLPTGTCQPFSRKIFVTARGQILPCEKIGHQFILGTANKESMCLSFDKIADIYNAYFDNIVNQCNECFLKSSCGICMFKEKIESEELKCSGFTDRKAFEYYFSQNISYVEQNPEIYSKILNKINYI